MRPFKSLAAAALLVAGVSAGPNDDLDTLSHMIDKVCRVFAYERYVDDAHH